MEDKLKIVLGLTKRCKETLSDKTNQRWGRTEKGVDRQTDLASASVSGGPLSRSVWGLQSFCSPSTPDLLPPDSSCVTNSHFLCIQCPPLLASSCLFYLFHTGQKTHHYPLTSGLYLEKGAVKSFLGQMTQQKSQVFLSSSSHWQRWKHDTRVDTLISATFPA